MPSLHAEITKDLLKIIPVSEQERVFGQSMCDIDPGFIGFVGTYDLLSEMIPKHFTVIDFGCAYNPQSYLFTKHKHFIAVDGSGGMERFQAFGTEVITMSAQEYIEREMWPDILETTFAICSYVPDDEAQKMIRETFKNLYVYYPHGLQIKPMEKS